jgi:DEAD/DEAH box helicase
MCKFYNPFIVTVFLSFSSFFFFHSAVEHYCGLNIRTGGLHPFNTLTEYQRFASALTFSNASPPTTTLSSDARTVTYKDKTLHLDDWVQGMRKAYNDSVSLVQLLCRKKDFLANLPSDFVDDMSNSSYGYSWLESAKSVESSALIKHLMSNADGDVPCKMGRDEALIWDAAWQLSWMRKAGELNQLMANLHHTVPGQPSRIAELCDFRLRNGLRGRNIFYSHGAIWLITRRVKSETLVQHEEFIPVKLPPELGQLYMLYLLFIRPVEIDFARRLWGQDTATLYHEYLYVINGNRLLEDHFYIQFKRWTEVYFKCLLGVRGYRQSVVVVARAYLGTEYELELEEEDDALIKQRGHGATADRRCYGVQSAYLSTLSSDLMFRFGHISEWWWRLTQFAPGKAPLLPLDLRRKTRSDDIYNPTNAPLPTTTHFMAHDEDRLAAMISAGVAAAIHSLKDNMEGIINTSVAAGVTEALSRQTSMQGLLTQHPSGPSRIDTGMDVDPPLNGLDLQLATPHLTPPAITNNIVASERMDIDSVDASQKAYNYLRLFYKDLQNPQFRSKGQQKMVEMAFAGTQNFVGVLPTGGGKSLVFLLPAFAATVDTPQDALVQKTVVIIPNRSLMDDTLKKAMKFGVSCAQWTVSTSERVIKDTALIVVAIESLASYKFKWYVSLV